MRRDQEEQARKRLRELIEVRSYRNEAGSKVAVRLAKASDAALDQIELDPGIGSPVLGKLLGIPGLRLWRVHRFPLLWLYVELADHVDVIRSHGERQDLAAILGSKWPVD